MAGQENCARESCAATGALNRPSAVRVDLAGQKGSALVCAGEMNTLATPHPNDGAALADGDWFVCYLGSKGMYPDCECMITDVCVPLSKLDDLITQSKEVQLC